jgi:hypothetical protein
VVRRKIVILTGIPEAAMIGDFKCLPAQSFMPGGKMKLKIQKR